MFDINHAIAEWRNGMLAAGIKKSPQLEELECHLRDDVRYQVSEGIPEAEAFQLAVRRIGSPESLRREFAKIQSMPKWPVVFGTSLWLGVLIVLALGVSGGLISGKYSLLLCAHAFTVTAGYTAAFLPGGFGLYYIYWTRLRRMPSASGERLGRAAQTFTQLAAVLIAGGIILGMLWSSLNSGKYWSGDAREVGALCACLWLVAMVLIQHFGLMSAPANMVLCVGGNLIVGIAWFCGNAISTLGIRRSYGIPVPWPLWVFVAVHIAFFVVGAIRLPKTSSPEFPGDSA